MAPPSLPADRVKTLRAAFEAMVKDREFVADVERAGEEFNPMPGDKLQAVIAAAANIPESVKARAREARGM
jgi:tripartite-type tricarboxylate transporter receptor subunit TctC